MNKSRLIELLEEYEEDDILIMIDDVAYEIDTQVERIPESFDGFDTAFPAAIGLKVKSQSEDDGSW